MARRLDDNIEVQQACSNAVCGLWVDSDLKDSVCSVVPKVTHALADQPLIFTVTILSTQVYDQGENGSDTQCF